LGLGGPFAPARQRLLQLAELFLEVAESPGRVRVIEAGRSGPALDLPRVDKRREIAGHVMEDPFASLLLALEAVPVLAHAAGRPGLDLAEDMRMAGDQLRVDPASDALEVTLPAFGQEQREEIDLEEEVAELVEQLGVVALLGRVGHLVSLLDRVRHDRAGRLLAIPGAIPPQPLGELLELEQRGPRAQATFRQARLNPPETRRASRWWWSASPRPAVRSRPDTSSSSRTRSWC